MALKPYEAPFFEIAEKEVSKTKEHNGGNTGLPFGLCAKYGIKLPDGATPRDAWEALKEKTGKSPDDFYKELDGGKGNGKEIHTEDKKPVESPKKTKSNDFFERAEEEVQEEGQESAPKQEEIAPTDSATKQERKTSYADKYGVDEGLARRAHESYSFSDYKEGSESGSYRSRVTAFEANVEELRNRYKDKNYTQEELDEVERLTEAYARNLANYTNENNRKEASYPSWAIAGPAKYNTRKNDAKWAAIRSLYEKNKDRIDPDSNIYLRKIDNILSQRVIKSGDSQAVSRLQTKYDNLKAQLETGKAMNAYYRKHGTMAGFEGISEEQAKKYDAELTSPNRLSRQPYPAYALQNGNAELHRIQNRIDILKRAEERAAEAKANPESERQRIESYYPKVDGVEVSENGEAMRLQLKFPGKPDDKTRTLLKSNGFRWSPSQGSWQRQLTNKARYSAKRVLEELAKNQ